ncbi:hypothetical protein Ddye_003928 [Dipteronia dyeriana]|uniref:Uncharacterized protein n=1 Tax=Dipteronia dyeriana TaxID=168575 RepID=A0AAD9XT69_9ROSI|nr:hypothetical protein Ddye_003928 [Dipteronia dyeriana]
MQLRTNGGNSTDATPSRPALETEDNVDLKQGPLYLYNAMIFQSIRLKYHLSVQFAEAYNVEAQMIMNPMRFKEATNIPLEEKNIRNGMENRLY